MRRYLVYIRHFYCDRKRATRGRDFAARQQDRHPQSRPERISWIGRCDLSYHELETAKDLRPVLIKAGSLGKGRPERDMLVSPNHRFSTPDDALMSARDLLDYRRILTASTLGVSYFHILCHAHEIILANGAWSESFHPDDAEMKATAPDQRQEVLLMFPEVATMGASRRFKLKRDIRNHLSRFET